MATPEKALVSRIRGALKLLAPQDITPMGVRIIEKILEDHEKA